MASNHTTATEAPRESPLSVRLNATTKKRIDRAARRNKMTRNAWITRALEHSLALDEKRAVESTRTVTPRLKGGKK